MKRNDLAEAKRLDQKSILEKVKILRKEITDLILDKNMNKLKDLKAINKKKKDIAQLLTILRQKELLEQLESREETKEASKKLKSKNLKKEKEEDKK